MRHAQSHPQPVEGCFGCQVANVGVQTLQIKHGSNPIQKRKVITEEGPGRGRVGGFQSVHWDGRQDVQVKPPTVALETKVRAD